VRIKIMSVILACLSIFMLFKTVLLLASSAPESTQTVSGLVTWVEVIDRKRWRSSVRERAVDFRLQNSDLKFRYPDDLAGLEAAVSRLKVGEQVEVKYSGSLEPELWGLSINSDAIINPDGVVSSRRKSSVFTLLTSLIFAAGGLWLWRSKK
jgi:hypothetical protein